MEAAVGGGGQGDVLAERVKGQGPGRGAVGERGGGEGAAEGAGEGGGGLHAVVVLFWGEVGSDRRRRGVMRDVGVGGGS